MVPTPRTDFQVIVFVLSLLYLSCRSDMQSDFDNWISWNVKSYRKKTILETKWNVSGTGKALDLNLRQAESNKVRITVSQEEGAADFKTITEAINSIPPRNTKRITVFIAPGVYREKVMIGRTLSFITLLGDAMDPPTITGNDTASISGRDGNPLGTFQSATVAVDANYFMAINIKFESCHLISITKKLASITAQKRTNSSQESGFSFKNSVVTGSGGQVYLGRAWGDYSRVVFSYTYMDKIVHPKGWSDWGDQNRDLMVYYGEYKCSGPGANMSARVSWTRILTDQEAQPFIGIHFIEGDTWLISP